MMVGDAALPLAPASVALGRGPSHCPPALGQAVAPARHPLWPGGGAPARAGRRAGTRGAAARAALGAPDHRSARPRARRHGRLVAPGGPGAPHDGLQPRGPGRVGPRAGRRAPHDRPVPRAARRVVARRGRGRRADAAGGRPRPVPTACRDHDSRCRACASDVGAPRSTGRIPEWPSRGRAAGGGSQAYGSRPARTGSSSRPRAVSGWAVALRCRSWSRWWSASAWRCSPSSRRVRRPAHRPRRPRSSRRGRSPVWRSATTACPTAHPSSRP